MWQTDSRLCAIYILQRCRRDTDSLRHHGMDHLQWLWVSLLSSLLSCFVLWIIRPRQLLVAVNYAYNSSHKYVYTISSGVAGSMSIGYNHIICCGIMPQWIRFGKVSLSTGDGLRKWHDLVHVYFHFQRLSNFFTHMISTITLSSCGYAPDY